MENTLGLAGTQWAGYMLRVMAPGGRKMSSGRGTGRQESLVAPEGNPECPVGSGQGLGAG